MTACPWALLLHRKKKKTFHKPHKGAMFRDPKRSMFSAGAKGTKVARKAIKAARLMRRSKAWRPKRWEGQKRPGRKTNTTCLEKVPDYVILYVSDVWWLENRELMSLKLLPTNGVASWDSDNAVALQNPTPHPETHHTIAQDRQRLQQANRYFKSGNFPPGCHQSLTAICFKFLLQHLLVPWKIYFSLYSFLKCL